MQYYTPGKSLPESSRKKTVNKCKIIVFHEVVTAKSYFYSMSLRYLPILFITLFVIPALYSSGEKTATKFSEGKEMVAFRKIGHELLLRTGDSTSRVLPVKQISDEEFHIFFERKLSITPDSFVNVVRKIAMENNFPPDFVANIVTCDKKEIAYAFIESPSEGDNTLCLHRKLPEDCYYISLLFPQGNDNRLRNIYIGSAVLLVLATLFFIVRRRSGRKEFTPGMVPEEKETAEESLRIGKYLFDFRQQYLELDGVKTALTNKESKLLNILASSPYIIIGRDTLQKEIWENEGVIVTRSLDMFISKLRKKLAGDEALKIVNVHGKGYKLEILTV